MKFHTFMDVLGGIVVLAIVGDIVTSPHTSEIVSKSGTAFANVIKAAKGKG